MKRMRTSAKKGRRPTCFACGAWPVAELSIAAFPHASQQAFLEAHEREASALSFLQELRYPSGCLVPVKVTGNLGFLLTTK